MKRLVVFAVFVAIIVCSAVSASALRVGDPAPDFAGVTIEGKEFRLSDLKGQPILLKIGTTW